MKLRPLFDKVVLKTIEEDNTTESGIILASEPEEHPQKAEVIAVGPGGVDDVDMVLNVGDVVIHPKYAGNKVEFDDEEYIVMSQADVLAVVENK